VVQAEAFGTGQENGLLPAVLESVRKDFEAIGRADPLCTATVLTDSGYHSEATLRQLADGDINALVADTGFRSRDPRFAEAYRHQPEDQPRKPGERHSKWLQAKHFDYDPAQRTCRCPAGKPLKLSTGNAIIKGRRGVSFEGTKQICGICPLRTHCLRKPGVSAYRQVTFFDGTKTRETHPHTKAMKARIDTPRRTPALQPTSGHRRTGRRPTCIRIGSDDSPCDPEERSMPSGSSSAWSTTCRSCKDMRRDVELGKPKRPRYGQAQSSLRLGRANRHDPPARDHQHDQTCAEGLQKYLR